MPPYTLGEATLCADSGEMQDIVLTGAQKSQLRGVGQTLEASFKIGKEGITPSGLVELRRQMASRELVKVRFLGADREARADLSQKVVESTGSILVGSVGHTALFYNPARTAPAA